MIFGNFIIVISLFTLNIFFWQQDHYFTEIVTKSIRNNIYNVEFQPNIRDV